MYKLFLSLLAALLAEGGAAAEAPERSSTVIVYGDDPCPVSSDGEIVVCARRPEGDRYRIPKELRNAGDRPSEVSWGARTQLIEDAARENIPGSCSTIGTYGQTGCYQQMLREWYDARRERRR